MANVSMVGFTDRNGKESTMAELDERTADDLVTLIEAKQEAKQAEERWRAVQPTIIEGIEALGQKSASVRRDGLIYKGTVVRSSSEVLDEDKLKTLLGAKLWRKVTSRKLDQSKLEDAIANPTVGITAADVARCTDTMERSPYVRGSMSKAGDA